MRRAAFLIAALAAVSLAQPTVAEAKSGRRAHIAVAYMQPTSPGHQPIYDRIMGDRALEQLKDVMAPFRLPRPLTIRTKGCDGMVDAWYEEGVITICYEYLEEVWKKLPADSPSDEPAPSATQQASSSDQGGSASGQQASFRRQHASSPAQGSAWPTEALLPPERRTSANDAFVGQVVEVVLHEFGHALFDQLGVPVLGREEDAADQLAAYMMLQFGKEEARRLVNGASYAFRMQMRSPQPMPMQAYADVHGTTDQRLYNLLCMAYGADPELFKDVLNELPKYRAEGCENEYMQLSYGFRRLIRPHVDVRAQKKIQTANWLRDMPSRPPPLRVEMPQADEAVSPEVASANAPETTRPAGEKVAGSSFAGEKAAGQSPVTEKALSQNSAGPCVTPP